MIRFRHFKLPLLFTVIIISCTGEESTPQLSPFELEHGIGPVTEYIELGEIDPELADRGEQIFRGLCIMCHNEIDLSVAPSMEGILDKRSPEYVMNMILNPVGMSRRHPSRLNMEERYFTSMPFQSVSVDDARAIVEYFRLADSHNQ